MPKVTNPPDRIHITIDPELKGFYLRLAESHNTNFSDVVCKVLQSYRTSIEEKLAQRRKSNV